MNFPRESAKAAGTPSASDRMVVATASAALKVVSGEFLVLHYRRIPAEGETLRREGDEIAVGKRDGDDKDDRSQNEDHHGSGDRIKDDGGCAGQLVVHDALALIRRPPSSLIETALIRMTMKTRMVAMVAPNGQS